MIRSNKQFGVLLLGLLVALVGVTANLQISSNTQQQLVCLTENNVVTWFNVSTVTPHNSTNDSFQLTSLLANGLRGELIEVSDKGFVVHSGGGSNNVRNRTIYGFTNFGEVFLIDLNNGSTSLVLQVPGRRTWDAMTTGFDVDPISGIIVLSRRDRLFIIPPTSGSPVRETQRLAYSSSDTVVKNAKPPMLVALAFAPAVRGPSVLYVIDTANTALSIVHIISTPSGGFTASITGVAKLSSTLTLQGSFISLDILDQGPTISRLGTPVQPPFAILSIGTQSRTTGVTFFSIDLRTGVTQGTAVPITTLYNRLRLIVLSCTFFQPNFNLLGGGGNSSFTGTGSGSTQSTGIHLSTTQSQTTQTSQTSQMSSQTSGGSSKTSSQTSGGSSKTSTAKSGSPTTGGSKTSVAPSGNPTGMTTTEGGSTAMTGGIP